MSKKKSFSGNTMTLKDFHGGSIPSDLPLPSAPGVVLRPTDWSGYDKPNAWGGSVGRTRPSSSPASRNFDDKTPFLSHTAHIGRNFDEDERKPLDGSSAPRRMISDESFRKLEPVSGGRGLRRGLGSQVVGSYLGIVSEGGSRGVSMRNVGDESGRSGGSLVPNVWTARKESAMGINGVMQLGSSEVSIVSKMAHASAIEKVSSRMWKTNNSLPHQIDVKVVNNSEAEKVVGSRFFDDYNNNWRDSSCGKLHADQLPRHIERGLTIEDGVQGGRKEFFDHDRVRAPLSSGINERKPWINEDGVQRPHNEVKMFGSEIQPQVQSEPLERPKLKLLPRTKPLDNFEAPNMDHKQGYQRPSNLAHGRMENVKELQANARTENPSFAGSESENHAAERPKLNLKPRSPPLEQLDRDSERERSALFGHARPREQILKDRGTEDAVISTNDSSQHLDRVKYNITNTEKMVEHAVPMRNHERYENQPGNHRNGKKSERVDQRGDTDKVDTQRRNWRRNGRDAGRQQQQQQHVNQERPPSPETWRKPEQPGPATPDAIAQRYTKAASAMELAQSFSRSVSDPKAADSYSSQKGLPSGNQIPFSRLVSPNARSQINGY